MPPIFPLAVIILATVNRLAGIDVRAVQRPAADIGYAEQVPSSSRPESTIGIDTPAISEYTEKTISYTGNLLTGRLESSSDLPERIYESRDGDRDTSVSEELDFVIESTTDNSTGFLSPKIAARWSRKPRQMAANPVNRLHPPSPCPSIFSYVGTKTTGHRWYGDVRLSTDETLTGVRLDIILDKPSQLIGTWLGEVSSVDNTGYTIWNGGMKIEPGKILLVKFFVKYSDKEVEPPRMREIRLNGRQICPKNQGSPSTAQPRIFTPMPPTNSRMPRPAIITRPNTTATTQVTPKPSPVMLPVTTQNVQSSEIAASKGFGEIFPTTVGPERAVNIGTPALSKETEETISYVEDLIAGRVESPTDLPKLIYDSSRDVNRRLSDTELDTEIHSTMGPAQLTPILAPIISSPPTQNGESLEIVDGVPCGIVEVQRSPFFTHGQQTSKGQWPWHAVLYQTKGSDLSYICSGSLIGEKIVLTAAHCVTRRHNDRPVDPESLVVYLGKYHLKLWSEGGVQDIQVRDIHVHPAYNSTDFRANIAILELSNPVEFTAYIKPVCLWDRNQVQLNELEGALGVVVGWGYDVHGMVAEDLMMAKMPIASQRTCILKHPLFFSHFTMEISYCASFRYRTSVCNGDSGSGMVFPKTSQPGAPVIWSLRGIVSVSSSLEDKRVCNTNEYVIFTDVAKFHDWVKQYL